MRKHNNWSHSDIINKSMIYIFQAVETHYMLSFQWNVKNITLYIYMGKYDFLDKASFLHDVNLLRMFPYKKCTVFKPIYAQ